MLKMEQKVLFFQSIQSGHFFLEYVIKKTYADSRNKKFQQILWHWHFFCQSIKTIQIVALMRTMINTKF